MPERVAQLRRGVRVGLDVGSVRIGVARSDPDGLLAVPVATVARHPGRDVAEIAALVVEYEPLELLVGLPVALDGVEGPAARAVREFAAEVARAVAPVPLRLVDERLSTVVAQRGLRAAGHTVRTSRGMIDAAAAVEIVQHALDLERGNGQPPGAALEPDDRSAP